MKLAELDPRFVRREVRIEAYERAGPTCDYRNPAHIHTPACWEMFTGPRVYLPFVDRIEDAQGVDFLCPKCFVANVGPIGTHRVLCWSRSRGIPDDAEPGPGRWLLVGSGIADLTLNGDGGSRSVALTSGCHWHGFVTAGEVTDA